MADYTDNVLRSSIKALDEVIQPALNPNDPLASEQLRLVSGFLKFLRARLDHRQPRHVFELNHYLTMAQDVLNDARLISEEAASRLDKAIANAATISLKRDATLADIAGATAGLASSVSGVVRLAATARDDLRRSVEARVVEGSKRWVDMQRAWFLPQGFDLHPGDIPPLEEALASGFRVQRRDE